MFDALAALKSITDRLPVGAMMIKRSEDRLEHDRAKFNEMEEVFGEVAVISLLDELWSQRVESRTLKPYYRYKDWGRRKGNEFLVKSVQRTRAEFDSALEELMSFVRRRLFTLEHLESSAYHFMPDENPDKGRTASWEEIQRFHADTEKLNALISSCDEAYGSFRRTVKKKLVR